MAQFPTSDTLSSHAATGDCFPPQTDWVMMGDRGPIFNGLPLLLPGKDGWDHTPWPQHLQEPGTAGSKHKPQWRETYYTRWPVQLSCPSEARENIFFLSLHRRPQFYLLKLHTNLTAEKYFKKAANSWVWKERPPKDKVWSERRMKLIGLITVCKHWRQ